ncbi:DUF4926 domain-containing protein [Micromonospora sp. NPDC005553]
MLRDARSWVGRPTAYEVEFTDTGGRTVATVTLEADQVSRCGGHR